MKEQSSAASRPLEGLTIVVTGSRRASEQSALVTNLGGTPYVVPTVGISIPSDDSEIEPFLRDLVGADGADYAVFMTATGVRAMMLAAERLGLQKAVLDALNSKRTTVVARSGKPRGELARSGIKVDASPPVDEATASGILRLLRARGLAGKRVAILWHGSKNPALGEGVMASGGGRVFECLTYRYSTSLGPEGAEVLRSIGFRYKAPEEQAVVQLINEIVEGKRRIDAMTFTSPPAVANLFEVAAEHGLDERLRRALEERSDIAIAAVGPSTRAELEGHGVRVDVVPAVSAMGAMMNALAAWATARHGGPPTC
ncbi:MAG TPA: uroporphyrinogen-III synthase [Nitrososphaerales archaeon]|nr:uroporphyrinogen-III synthase [Nitrososphaerales archaeon]